MLDLSIVIVSWNTKDITRDCLESVYKETKDIAFEVIVVDNNSADGSQRMIKDEFPQVTLIESPTNVGFAAGNNLGFEVATGEFVLLLNSDTIVLDGALQKTLSYARTKPDYGIISCKMLNKDKSLQPNCFMLPSVLNSLLFLFGLYKLLPKNKFFGRAEMTWWDYKGEMDVEALKGCFMLARKNALDDVGGMDEHFFMYSEEIDWCIRFSKRGWKLGYYPDAEVIHLGGISAAKLGPDRAQIKDTSNFRFMRKHWSTTRFYIGALILFLFYISRLPFAALLYLLTKKPSYRLISLNHTSGLKGLLTLSTFKNSRLEY